ncbi:phage tail length tape measure family protein [Hydrogenophaga sp.]|uniref:phage tail length tape measure family protein n=1 Tax=Hydrogenophaga sp. TaxID=1904254 RepID=UPI003D0A8B16
MAWKGTELVIRIAADLKKYRDGLRDAGRETRAEMERAARSTDGMTAATKRLESQAEKAAEKVVSIGKAAASGDFARAGQEMAGMASGAARAGSTLGGLGLALGAAGVAALAFVAVSEVASDELERQTNLLRLTGNAAGLLAGDINAMARRVARDANSTVGSAREITEALVSTGKFGRTATESVAGAIELMTQASGRSRDSVTADFAKMSDGVAKWAATANEKYHFLTLAQYEHIKALEEAGRVQEAMIVVGEAFRKHLDGVGENLGYLQRAWNAMGQAASWAWDKVLNVGRAQTTSDQLRTATDNVNEMRGRLEYQQSMGFAGLAARTQRTLDAALQEQALLQEKIRLELRSAAAQADNAAAEQRAIEEVAAAEKERAEQRKRDLEAGELRNRLATEAAREQERERARASKLAAADAEEQRKRELAVGELRNRLASEAWKEQERMVEAARKADAAMTKVYEDSAAAAQQRLESLQIENEAAAYAEQHQISLARAIELTTIARLKESQVAAMGNESVVMAIQAEIDAREQLVQAMGSREVREAGEKLRKDEEAAWQRTWDQVGQSFTDALMEGGRSVKEYLIGLFRTMILRPILAPIGNGFASAMGGGGAAGNSGILGGFNNLTSLYNAVTSGFSGFGNMVGSIGSSMQYGTAMFSQQSQMLAAQEAGMGTLSGSMGSAASALGGAMVGMVLGKMISGGYSAIGKSGNTAVAAGTAIGSIFGPLGAVIGGVIGGVVNVAFGRKLASNGIQGTFGGEQGFRGKSWELHKGGWFRSDKWTYNPLDEGVRSEMALQYNALTDSSVAMADALGLSSDALANYRHSFEITTKGLSADQVNALLTAEFAKMANAQARLIMGTSEYIRRGEDAVATLTRLSNSITVVNQVFDTLGLQAYDVGLAGGDMASQLADLFGGLQNFGTATDAYYQAYYTDAERAATTTRQMGEAMAQLSLEMPTSRDGFRSLVEAQDLTTEAGREAYAALMTLAPVFNGLMSHADQLADTLAHLGSSVADEVQRLRGLLTTDSTSSMAALQAQFATSTAAARAGDQAALERLPFLSQAIEDAARLQAVTAADVALMRGQLAASLSATLAALGLPVPQFATGGMHRGGLRLVGERGPEIEVTGPARYFSARETAAMVGGGNNPALLAELQALRSEVVGLRAEVRAGVAHGAQSARILSRVSRNGEAFQTEAVAES